MIYVNINDINNVALGIGFLGMIGAVIKIDKIISESEKLVGEIKILEKNKNEDILNEIEIIKYQDKILENISKYESGDDVLTKFACLTIIAMIFKNNSDS